MTWRRKVNAGSWSTIRTVDYDYYGSGDSKGTLGDLKMITVKDSAGTMIDKEYSRRARRRLLALGIVSLWLERFRRGWNGFVAVGIDRAPPPREQ